MADWQSSRTLLGEGLAQPPFPEEAAAAQAGEGVGRALPLAPALANSPETPAGFPAEVRPRTGAAPAAALPGIGETATALASPAAEAPASFQDSPGQTALFPAPLLERLKAGAEAAFSSDSSADSRTPGGVGDSRALDAPEAAGAEPGQAAPLSYGETLAPTVGAEEKAAGVERAVSRIIDDLSSIKAGQSQIRIVLEPEELGTLTITVSHGAGGVSARIKTDNQEICAMMNDHLPSLVQAMETNGVAIDRVDVFWGQAGQEMDLAHSGQGRRQEQQPPFSTLAARTAAGDGAAPDWPVFLGLGQEGFGGPDGSSATVEYRA